jgi:hypothetical protein
MGPQCRQLWAGLPQSTPNTSGIHEGVEGDGAEGSLRGRLHCGSRCLPHRQVRRTGRMTKNDALFGFRLLVFELTACTTVTRSCRHLLASTARPSTPASVRSSATGSTCCTPRSAGARCCLTRSRPWSSSGWAASRSPHVDGHPFLHTAAIGSPLDRVEGDRDDLALADAHLDAPRDERGVERVAGSSKPR